MNEQVIKDFSTADITALWRLNRAIYSIEVASVWAQRVLDTDNLNPEIHVTAESLMSILNGCLNRSDLLKTRSLPKFRVRDLREPQIIEYAYTEDRALDIAYTFCVDTEFDCDLIIEHFNGSWFECHSIPQFKNPFEPDD